MSRHTFVFSSTALRSLELEREAVERENVHKRWQSHCVKLRRRGEVPELGKKQRELHRPLLCEDRLIHNALYTGDSERVRCFFSRGTVVDVVIEASGNELQWTSQKLVTAKAEGPAWELWQALLLGDEETVVLLITDPDLGHLHPNIIFDTSDVEQWKNYRYNIRALRIWSLCYKQEFTCPLQITASRGYATSLQHLLSCGAEVDFAPGGKTALHEACENAQAECVRLLLSYEANPNALSEDGYTPLHLCSSSESLQCAKHLLAFGGHVNSRTEDKDDTPLHIAARFGLEEHVELYLGYGASINRMNDCGQTPLHCVCAQSHSHEDAERYYRVCKLLIEKGASVMVLEEEQQSALHLACRTANYRMVDLLLHKGIDVNRMDYGGNAPMHKALQAVAYKLEHQPERTIRSLLNYGSIRIWPGAIPKEHQEFYDSLFALSQTPRCLQHLARCAIRSHFEGRCQEVVPYLPLPAVLRDYLLLRFQDFVN
uniref:ankyrin repeat and SOCS box protein 10 isoform X2 n=1 Tax=Pristiophorus japonicus TaxID=55135 RepID=UPI00398E4977